MYKIQTNKNSTHVLTCLTYTYVYLSFIRLSKIHARGPLHCMLPSFWKLCRITGPQACIWLNASRLTSLSKVNAVDKNIHHAVSLALSPDLFHIMLSNVRRQIIGRYDDQQREKEREGESCEWRCRHGRGINLHSAFCRLSRIWKKKKIRKKTKQQMDQPKARAINNNIMCGQ